MSTEPTLSTEPTRETTEYCQHASCWSPGTRRNVLGDDCSPPVLCDIHAEAFLEVKIE